METSNGAEPSSHALINDAEVGNSYLGGAEDVHSQHSGQQDLPLHQLEVQVSTTNSGDGSPSGRYPYFTSCDFKEAIVCLLFCFICCIIVIARVEPKQRPIPYQLLASGDYVLNLSYNEPFDGDTVPDGLGVFLAAVLPLLSQLGLTKFCNLRGDAHATLCCYLVAFGITMLTTFAVKNYVGYLRPAFYELCDPNDDFSECTIDEGDGTYAFAVFIFRPIVSDLLTTKSMPRTGSESY